MSSYRYFSFSSKIVHSTLYTNCSYYRPSDRYLTFFYTNERKCRKRQHHPGDYLTLMVYHRVRGDFQTAGHSPASTARALSTTASYFIP